MTENSSLWDYNATLLPGDPYPTDWKLDTFTPTEGAGWVLDKPGAIGWNEPGASANNGVVFATDLHDLFNTGPVTFLYRTEFTLTADQASSTTELLTQAFFEDGGIAYINGAPVLVDGMQSAATSISVTTVTILSPTQGMVTTSYLSNANRTLQYRDFTIPIPEGLLHEGTNQLQRFLAVETHNANPNSLS